MFLADLAYLLKEGIELGLGIVFVIFCLRLLLRKDWLAALVLAVLAAIIERRDDPQPLAIACFVVLFFGLAFVLLRLGLIATITSIALMNLLGRTPGAQDLSKWYEWTVVAYPLLAIAIVLWAFWQSSGEEAMAIRSPDS